jgi:hypothetical protein
VETFDQDDAQAAQLAILEASTVMGRRKYSIIRGADMEDLCYDATMPVDAPAWRSIEEADVPEPPPAAPPIDPRFMAALVDAFGGNKVAAAVTLALLPVVLCKGA